MENRKKIGNKSSLEFKFFSIKIIFEDFFLNVFSGCFYLFVLWNKRGEEDKEGGHFFFPKHFNFYTEKHF